MARQKVLKHEEKLRQITPLIREIKIQRLKEDEALEFLEKNGEKMSRASYYKYKKDYEENSGRRFLHIAKVEYADEHLVLLDRLQDTVKRYYELLEESDSIVESKQLLDSIRANCHDILLMYNEVPIVQKIKDTIDEELGRKFESGEPTTEA